jgi:hypothetical protein
METITCSCPTRGLLGTFREIFEPWWKESVQAAMEGRLTYHDKFAIAGYMADLMVCTPTWRRIGVSLVNQQTTSYLSFSKRMKVKHGGQPDLPVDAVEALERGEIALDTDQNYPKGLATINLMQYTRAIYKLDWVLLRNNTTEPFVTSDNPVSLNYSGSSRISIPAPHTAAVIERPVRSDLESGWCEDLHKGARERPQEAAAR